LRMGCSLCCSLISTHWLSLKKTRYMRLNVAVRPFVLFFSLPSSLLSSYLATTHLLARGLSLVPERLDEVVRRAERTADDGSQTNVGKGGGDDWLPSVGSGHGKNGV
jgi:hypothetical protein